MPWVRVRINDIGQSEYQGLSTDGPKPTDCKGGSTAIELDTGAGYVYDEVNTNPVTNDGWWPVEV